MFDAYTVKKVLPRLVIAVVLIQLSWFIFTGMISLTTAVAYGVEGLIYAPFGGGEALELDNILMSTPGGVGLFSLMAVAGGLGVLGIAMSLAGTALLALLFAFAMLMFRQVLIVALLVISPLALVAWILPNTEKFWKLWWESFSKLLLVYPLILGMIAIGRVFAFITAGVEPGGETENLFTSFGADVIIKVCFIVICFFGPFFFIPKLFSIAGSAFGFVAGMANDKSRGAFDRLKKGRQEKRGQQWQGFKTGGGKERTAIGRGFNAVGRRVGAGAGNRYGFGTRGKEKLDQIRRTSSDELAKTAAAQAIGEDDHALEAATYKNYKDAVAGLTPDIADGLMKSDPTLSRADALIKGRATAERAAKSVQASIGYGQNQADWAARRMVDTGTSFRDQDHLSSTLSRVANGNSSTAASLAGYANAKTKAVGRGDLAPGFGNLYDQVRANGGIAEADGSAVTAPDVNESMANAWESVSLYQHGNGKPKTIDNLAKHFKGVLADATASTDDKLKAAKFFAEMDTLKNSGSGAAAEAAVAASHGAAAELDAYYANLGANNPSQFGTVTETVEETIPVANGPAGATTTRKVAVRRAATPAERAQNARRAVQAESRAYVPPDPNNI